MYSRSLVSARNAQASPNHFNSPPEAAVKPLLAIGVAILARTESLGCGLAIFLIAVVLLQLLVQVSLNLWNRHFFDALERKDGHAFGFKRNCLFRLPWGAFCWRRRQFGAA